LYARSVDLYATGLGVKAFWSMGVICMIPECFQVSQNHWTAKD